MINILCRARCGSNAGFCCLLVLPQRVSFENNVIESTEFMEICFIVGLLSGHRLLLTWEGLVSPITVLAVLVSDPLWLVFLFLSFFNGLFTRTDKHLLWVLSPSLAPHERCTVVLDPVLADQVTAGQRDSCLEEFLMPTNVVFLTVLQHETPEMSHTMFAKRHNIASVVVQLRCHWLWCALMTVQALTQMLAFSTVLVPMVYLKHTFFLFNMTFTTSYRWRLPLSVIYVLVAPESIIWESKFFFPSNLNLLESLLASWSFSVDTELCSHPNLAVLSLQRT